ncbi:GNAT family N-acetyltransferase [Marinomonas sp. UCMA 3892]|uniref:GNAT family N-acetyltransferase n=1 Tax=Marinomonas sp. UCMA 3892 TaxID=1972585 RepID=UPI001469FB6A|nr:GNAT family N-acetyltransferase [Marinomonas sp. UCMA 3892]NLU97027.1 GNAT family N-acetyltransferase [Marinomonas sp. UCMA 3892]|tara:strand:- start:1355 stop:1888 length:534 start_codon:yes stop_codon:yes gene_type:complete
MPIQPITQTMWAEILKIQAEAYSAIEPESLEVLQSKWQQSPDCCFAYLGERSWLEEKSELEEQGGQEKRNILGYLLAHAWHGETPPKLYQPLPEGSHGPILFLHDLALSKRAVGRGVGSQMVTHLLDTAVSSGFQKALLVSVQDSVSFWQKHGFVEMTDQQASESYGEDAKVMMRAL